MHVSSLRLHKLIRGSHPRNLQWHWQHTWCPGKSPRTTFLLGGEESMQVWNQDCKNIGLHIPVIGPSRVGAVCSARLSHRYRNEKRPRPARSIIRCETCDVHLCLNSKSNCFLVWHTQQTLFLQQTWRPWREDLSITTTTTLFNMSLY